MSVNEKDSRGYYGIHRAFEKGTWEDIKEAVDHGASTEVLTLSGASLEDFTVALNLGELYQRLLRYTGKQF